MSHRDGHRGDQAGEKDEWRSEGLIGDGLRMWPLATLPSFCYTIPFHHSTDWVLMWAGEVGTQLLLPLAASSLPIGLCPSNLSLVLYKRCSAGVTLLLFELSEFSHLLMNPSSAPFQSYWKPFMYKGIAQQSI